MLPCESPPTPARSQPLLVPAGRSTIVRRRAIASVAGCRLRQVPPGLWGLSVLDAAPCRARGRVTCPGARGRRGRRGRGGRHCPGTRAAGLAGGRTRHVRRGAAVQSPLCPPAPRLRRTGRTAPVSRACRQGGRGAAGPSAPTSSTRNPRLAGRLHDGLGGSARPCRVWYSTGMSAWSSQPSSGGRRLPGASRPPRVCEVLPRS